MKNEIYEIASEEEVKETIDALEYFVSGECTDNQFDFLQEINLAVESLKKHIPVKPKGKYTDFQCSVCGRRVRSGKGSSSRVRDNYCQRCGQRLDWRK